MGTRTMIHNGTAVVGAAAAIALVTAGARASAHPGATLIAAGLATAVLTVPRHHRRPLGAWAFTYLAFAIRRRDYDTGVMPVVCPGAAVLELDLAGTALGTLSDGYGWAAALELVAPGEHVHSAGIPVPDAAALAGRLTMASASDADDAPSAGVQVLTVLARPYQRAFVIVRVGDDGMAWAPDELRAALTAAIGRLRRRLTGLDVPHHPLDAAGLRRAIAWCAGDTSGRVHEAWDHLRVADRWQTTVGLPAGASVAYGGLLVRLAEAAGAPTIPAPRASASFARASSAQASSAQASFVVAQAGSEITVRVVTDTPAALASAVGQVTSAAGGRVTHPDGGQLAALRDTLPIGRPGRQTATTKPATTEPATEPVSAAATRSLPSSGLFLGRGRQGEAVHVRLDPDRAPVRITVVGGPTALRLLADRARTLTRPAERPGGSPVPVTLAGVARPTEADNAVLTGADVVVCQPMPTEDAAVVAAALGLAGAGEWLSRIEGDMVAVVSDGAVRWLRLSATADEQRRFPGLAVLARA